MATVPAPTPEGRKELLEEHDRLAEKVATRASIEHVRRSAYGSFFSVVVGGLAIKFAWDRWGWGPHRAPIRTRFPLLFFLSLALAVASAWFATGEFLRARRIMKTEDEDFTRLRELRERLGMNP